MTRVIPPPQEGGGHTPEWREFELSDQQLERIKNASSPVPAMFLSGGQPMFGTPQENANVAWQSVAQELGFIWSTAQPIHGKGERYVLAKASVQP